MIFLTLYATLPHNLIKKKLIDLSGPSKAKVRLFLHVTKERLSLLLNINTNINFGHVKIYVKPCKYTFKIISIFNIGTRLYRQIVGIPMGANCAPLVADLFLFWGERDFMAALSNDKQSEIIEAFNSISRYLDDLLNIENTFFEGMVNQIYLPKVQLNKANSEAPFSD
ncbi:MAG: hypothetical protein AB2693_34780 [Candidatus Thiodiazotropha sp.]